MYVCMYVWWSSRALEDGCGGWFRSADLWVSVCMHMYMHVCMHVCERGVWRKASGRPEVSSEREKKQEMHVRKVEGSRPAYARGTLGAS